MTTATFPANGVLIPVSSLKVLHNFASKECLGNPLLQHIRVIVDGPQFCWPGLMLGYQRTWAVTLHPMSQGTQGSQFTPTAFTGVLRKADIAISMDGPGRCIDNIFIERLWRPLKYVSVYLHVMTDGVVAERLIGDWLDCYDTQRPHSSLGGQTPAEFYAGTRAVDKWTTVRAGLNTSPQAQQKLQDSINVKKNLAA